MADVDVTTLVALVALSVVHLASGALRLLRFIPRSRLLSVAGGVAVGFVFLQLLPVLATVEQGVLGAVDVPEELVRRDAYLAALLGLILFYGTERAIKVRGGVDARAAVVARELFAVSLAPYAALNAVIGYLVAHGDPAGRPGPFVVAMGLQFLVIDRGLYEDHGDLFDRVGRPALVGALILGGVVGSVADVPAGVLNALRAFLAGGVILNVMKEELPEERESAFGAFALGALISVAVLFV